MIKRYSECCCYQENPNGGLVEYEDHIAEVGRLLSLLQECMDFACPNGETPTSDLACRITAVLEQSPAPRQASNPTDHRAASAPVRPVVGQTFPEEK